MPELPDVSVYVDAIATRVVGHRLQRVTIANPFLLRSFEPSPQALSGRVVREVRRLGKRIAIGVEGELWLVLHLMIAGRLHWYPAGNARRRRAALATLDFDNGSLTLTEAGTKRRASLHVVAGDVALASHDPGGLEISAATSATFAARITAANHTLKRALTDPRILSGIGNAYSDEILHRARLSPLALTQLLAPDELERLFEATCAVLAEWTARLRPRRRASSRKASPPFAKRWPCTGVSARPARFAAPGCSAFAMRRTRPTTARAARPRDACSPTVRCRGC